jgi:mono/diheme cytochrome c family protein
MLMKVKIFTLAMLLFVGHAWAQTAEMSTNGETGKPARTAGDIVPLPTIKSLTAPQAAGKKLFVQRCAVCHLPALPSYTTYGPLLSGSVISALGDEAARAQISGGSARMPGYQYTLSAQEIDQIVGYLKTLEFVRKD